MIRCKKRLFCLGINYVWYSHPQDKYAKFPKVSVWEILWKRNGILSFVHVLLMCSDDVNHLLREDGFVYYTSMKIHHHVEWFWQELYNSFSFRGVCSGVKEQLAFSNTWNKNCDMSLDLHRLLARCYVVTSFCNIWWHHFATFDYIVLYRSRSRYLLWILKSWRIYISTSFDFIIIILKPIQNMQVI